MQTKSTVLYNIIVSVVVSLCTTVATIRLAPKFLPTQASTAGEKSVATIRDEHNELTSPEPTDFTRLLAKLESAAWSPDDPGKPAQQNGVTDEELAAAATEDAIALCDEALVYLRKENGNATHWCGLGRIYYAYGSFDTARECFENATAGELGAAYRYLASSQLSPDEKTSWTYLEKAVASGYKPARQSLDELANKVFTETDLAFGDGNDPDRPEKAPYVSDNQIRAMLPADVESMIEKYGFVADKPGVPPRIAYELGRAAYLHNRQSEAYEFLTLAAKKGSGAAKATLANSPYTNDELNQMKLLEEAVALKYEPAKLRLEHIRENRRVISGVK